MGKRDVVSYGNGDTHIRIEGLNSTIRSLKRAGAQADDLKDLMHSIGEVVVREAQSDVPKVSGSLAATIRAGRGSTKAVVRAGGARARYAGAINYGWPARNIRATHFLTDAANRNEGTAVNMLEEGFQEILRKSFNE